MTAFAQESLFGGGAGGDGSMLMSFLPVILLSIPLALANYFLAPRLGKSAALWAILSFIPFFGWCFTYYVFYRALFSALDRVAALEKQR